MFYISKDTELTVSLLEKMINRFNLNRKPYLEKMKKYYDGGQAILQKGYINEDKAHSRVVTNYCKNITDSYCGYMAAPGCISYSSEEDITDIMEILKYNDYQDEDSDFLLDALIYGTAAELMYTDESAKVRFRLINPTSCFGIYDDSLSNDLLYFVRWYKASEWDESDLYNVDVYDNAYIKHYTMNGANAGFLTLVSEEPHYFGQCPANIFNLRDEKSVFDCILSLQDASNELLSAEIDDFSAFCDAYLVLTNVNVQSKADAEKIKAGSMLMLPEGATASFLTKNASDTQVENILQRIHNSIYRIAACPDFSSESFVGGVSSGVAIRYRLTGMETRAAAIAADMKKALQRRIEIICGIASLKLGEEVFRDIQISFKRNIPEDENSYLEVVKELQGIVSDKALLGQIPFIQDVNAEIEAIQEQKQNNVNIYQGAFKEEEEVNDEE